MPMVSVDIETIPTMHTEGPIMLVSDSGTVRYRVSGNIWQVFSKAAEPYEYFPEGIHVEQFDSLYQVEGDILADTAYHFANLDLWHAIGNVVLKNVEGRIFETSELFWNNRVPLNTMDAFYTHKQVKVIEPDGSFYYGLNGFTADRSLVNIRFYKLTGEINVVESTDTLQQNTIRPDSFQDQ